MSVLDFLKPPSAAPPIADAGTVQQQYRYWRWRVFYSMYIGYAFYYFTRKSYTFAMPSLMADLGFTKADLGALGSVMAITYGLSKFLSGIQSDRSNPRYFMSIGLILTGLANICFGYSSSLLLFALFWGINGWFQGWGWPPCAKLLTHWYGQAERGTWWGIWNTSHNVGGALIPILATYCAAKWGWRSAMMVPGIICLIGGVFLMNRLTDTPKAVGLPSIEKFRGEAADEPETTSLPPPSAREILFKLVLSNGYLWILGLAYFFVYAVRTAVNDWSVLFFVEHRNYTLLAAGTCIFWFEAGGFCGSLAAGWLSDRLFAGRRGPINVLFCLGVSLAVGLLWFVPAGWALVDSLLMFVIGFLIFGPQMLIGVAAAELSHKSTAGSATGFIGWIGYLGAAGAGYPMGLMMQHWGWESYYIALVVCGISSVLLLAPLWSTRAASRSLPSA
ncbi:MAG: phosphoglycerate transporter protein PgtP [Chlamydiia bacterium]